ncbi:uncharacterized protein LOC142767038 [Rhipicephalus microplus]|uniref:uncharacterized protein LOC142767038 n=1 Tax=Rhipicephalus microplus TaxID=6941 RepID=UPI003F6CE0FF
MLNVTEKNLILFMGQNGILMRNQRICWSSSFLYMAGIGVMHKLMFFQKFTVDFPEKGEWNTRYGTYYVGPVNDTPTLLLHTSVHTAFDRLTSFDYIIYNASDVCYVVGNLNITERPPCALWIQNGTEKHKQDLCVEAYNSSCRSYIKAKLYAYNETKCNHLKR